ncbi:MAG: hypothetical protein ACI8V5_001383, partial [Limisphaerales bacterium]
MRSIARRKAPSNARAFVVAGEKRVLPLCRAVLSAKFPRRMSSEYYVQGEDRAVKVNALFASI